MSWYVYDVDCIFQSCGELMSKDNPKHTNRFNSIKHIEDIMFIGKYFSCFIEIKAC